MSAPLGDAQRMAGVGVDVPRIVGRVGQGSRHTW